MQLLRHPDTRVALCFLAVGAAVILTARTFPAGVGSLPGPAFFPVVLGGFTTLLAALVLFRAIRSSAETQAAASGNLRAIGIVIALLAGYLLLWGYGTFLFRTLLFLTLLLRLFGESWRAALIVAGLLSAFVVLVFQYGLRVSLS